jgi:L,D-transpeptidase-like protein
MRQVLLALGASWNATKGELYRLEAVNDWENAEEITTFVKHSLSQLLLPIPISFGKAGLGWGRGMPPHFAQIPPIIKSEGDLRSPAGVFELEIAFGYEPEEGLRFPYLLIDKELECVDDPASRFYNQFVRRSHIEKDWASSERMWMPGKLYERGIVIAHNRNPILPGAGSCIFIHKWRHEGAPTAGCTAMSAENLKSVLSWLDKEKRPLLIQLPLEALNITRVF